MDIIPVTGGSRQSYSGGLITILYFITVTILIGGVFTKYKYYNTRIENSDFSPFDARQELQSSFVLTLTLYASHYSLKGFDLCDIVSKDSVSSSYFELQNVKASCTQLQQANKKTKAGTNVYQVIVTCEDCKILD